tara:strand:- start:205 stop:348 length:144 start_codon:yes stop_codon:yes gene_type:complete
VSSLPIADDNPITLIRFQVVTVCLIAVNVVVFGGQSLLDGSSGLASA